MIEMKVFFVMYNELFSLTLSFFDGFTGEGGEVYFFVQY